MAYLRRIAGLITDSTDYVVLAKGRERDTYELGAKLQRAGSPYAGIVVHGDIEKARKIAHQTAAELGVSIIYEMIA